MHSLYQGAKLSFFAQTQSFAYAQANLIRLTHSNWGICKHGIIYHRRILPHWQESACSSHATTKIFVQLLRYFWTVHQYTLGRSWTIWQNFKNNAFLNYSKRAILHTDVRMWIPDGISRNLYLLFHYTTAEHISYGQTEVGKQEEKVSFCSFRAEMKM